MKKKIATVLFIGMAAVQLTACIAFTCKEQGCDETDIYEDGYCKYHYGINAGEEALKDIINNWGN